MTTKDASSRENSVDDLCRQKSVFCVITVVVVAVLLLLHVLFSSVLGRPSLAVFLILGLALILSVVELVWLRNRSNTVTEQQVKLESCFSIAATFALTAVLTYITNRDESPYFVLLAIPILQSAYVFGLLSTILSIVASDGLIFIWLRYYFQIHPPARVSQYLEGGMLSVIYMQMGLLVWFLVDRLKTNQTTLSATLTDLRATRERLISEEKLAAVGRLASGIAHEIRNPVAMISSSLSTAIHPETEVAVREEMFAIAAQESKRLEHLTADFLSYAPAAQPFACFDERPAYLCRERHQIARGKTLHHYFMRVVGGVSYRNRCFSGGGSAPQSRPECDRCDRGGRNDQNECST
jgi:two-component system, NtrC family, sensor histidine kinase HydH